MRTFGEEQPVQVSRQDLAHIIEARVEEIFELVLQEIKRSGYDGLLPAGMVLTGGTSLLPGIRSLASRGPGDAGPHRPARKPGRAGRSAQLPGLLHQRRAAVLGHADERNMLRCHREGGSRMKGAAMSIGMTSRTCSNVCCRKIIGSNEPSTWPFNIKRHR